MQVGDSLEGAPECPLSPQRALGERSWDRFPCGEERRHRVAGELRG
ncbi:MAG: hypothetical protein BIP78_1529 [Candidatus Bipolaricaulis sibiricus]|uniref:Uncharacterized protein n=1 Tax=Bipolaricaulis sibiricus TaxID=2501609 RepID=A0A410FW06_BIPS1|nr:MAG: hypothetical protein BIP78_1529 [Candidatus Bipolaricaulis sibiricus]